MSTVQKVHLLLWFSSVSGRHPFFCQVRIIQNRNCVVNTRRGATGAEGINGRT